MNFVALFNYLYVQRSILMSFRMITLYCYRTLLLQICPIIQIERRIDGYRTILVHADKRIDY